MIQDALTLTNLTGPAWLVSVAVSTAAGVRTLLWLRGEKKNPHSQNGSRRATDQMQGEFQGTVKTLLAAQVDLTRQMHEEMMQHGELLEAHGQLVAQSADAIGKMAATLVEHDQRETEVWDEVTHCLKGLNDKLDGQ